MSPFKNSPDKHGRPQGGISLKTVLPALVVVAFVAGMGYLLSPSSNLEPYKIQDRPLPEKKSAANKPPERDMKVRDVKSPADEPAVKIADKAPEPPKPSPALPEETMRHIARAMHLTDNNKFPAADEEFAKAVELSPDKPEVHAIWGAALRMQKKYEGAGRHLAKAMELAPNDEEIVFNYGLVRLEERSTKEAIELFEKALKLNPKNPLTYNYLGKAFGQRKEYVKETEMYNKALEINPNLAPAHFNLGVVLSIRNMVNDAAPHFERAIELDKEFEQPFVVQMLQAMGRYKNKDKSAATQTAQADGKRADASEHAGHNMGGDSGKDAKDNKADTHVSGRVLINGDPVKGEGIVYLEPNNKLKVPGQKIENITIHQKNLQFSPRNTVVQVGATITFANDDLEVHNVFSKSQKNQFNLGAMAAGSSREFTTREPGPIILRCTQHKDMVGTVFVVPNGYYTHPDQDGKFEFNHVSNLDYTLIYWSPRLNPEEIEAGIQGLKLSGADTAHEFKITTASKPGEIHDLVDQTDYKTIADSIEKEVFAAIEEWKNKKTYISQKRMLIAITQLYDGEGLKGAFTKSFSEKRGQIVEEKLDTIRKKIAGLGEYQKNPPTEEALKSDATQVMAQIRANIQELENRNK